MIADLKADFKQRPRLTNRDDTMAEQGSASDLYQVARIVSSYVRHHQIGPDELTRLIVEVHRTLASLGRGTPSVPERPPPAVPIRRSVQRDYVVCLECGFAGKILRRHLQVQHGLDVAAYRARWNLPPNYPLTAPVYSERRAAMAKELGLGRRPLPVEPPPPPTRRRRRQPPTKG
jgi:predicted transcriptional regulator